MVAQTAKKKTKKIILFAGIAGIPAFFIVMLAYSSSTVFEQLPYFGPKQVIDGDTVYYKVPDFTFIDHQDNVVSNETLEGKILLVSTAMETCPEECPIHRENLKILEDNVSGTSSRYPNLGSS